MDTAASVYRRLIALHGQCYIYRIDFHLNPSHLTHSEVSMCFQIAPEIESQLDEVAERTGESKAALVQKALLSYLEDRQDALRVEVRLKSVETRISLEEIGRKYGLVD